MLEFNSADIQTRLVKALSNKLDTLPLNRMKKRTIQRATIDVSGLNPVDWLNAQDWHTKIFWSGREAKQKVAACGAVHHIVTDSLDVMRAIRGYLVDADPAVRYFGGMRFNPEQLIAFEWLPYAKFRFVLPRFELLTSNESQTLSINFFISPDEKLPELFMTLKTEIEKLSDPSHTDDRLPQISASEEHPTKKEWSAMLDKALGAIDREEYEKIVLAGKTVLSFQDQINPYQLLQKILKKNGRTFHFAFQFEHGISFIGMSPECLFQREGDHICTEAIAATRPRGATPDEDEQLGQEMYDSDKDLREHRWVKKMIIDRLSPYCMQIDETSDEKLLKLSHVQHLVSEFHADVREGVQNEQILDALHPTPAVGGYPKKDSVERISQLEPFDRGWYAAPVGWVSQDAAEFAVAIRSALVSKTKLHVFAGSGIVKGSLPEREWDENRNKAQNFLQLFDIK
jgi:menaquinone-specific isochorismate synthase